MPSFLDVQLDKIRAAAHLFLSLGSGCSPIQLVVALSVGFGFLAWRTWRRRGRIPGPALLRALKQSRRIAFSPSSRADLIYALVNTLALGGLIGWGLFSSEMVSRFVVSQSSALFGARHAADAPIWIGEVIITLATFLGYEIGYYADHYLKHNVPVLWEFHKSHHTAENLTPLTVFRVHPVDTLIFADIIAVCSGAVHGLVTYAFGRTVPTLLLDNGNIILAVFFIVLAPLQHSQFWIPFKGLAGRLLLSPAHHQLHHSADARHYGCNLGGFLAIFDWMFGTLRIPTERPPRLVFGVGATEGDPHSLSGLLIHPFVEAIRVAREGLAQRLKSGLKVGTYGAGTRNL